MSVLEPAFLTVLLLEPAPLTVILCSSAGLTRTVLLVEPAILLELSEELALELF